MVKLRKFSKRKTRRLIFRKKSMPYKSFMGKIIKAPVRISGPLYIARNGSDYGYSLSTGFGSYSADILPAFKESAAFDQLSDAYAYFTIDSCTARFIRGNVLEGDTVACIPEFYVDLITDMYTGVGGLKYDTITQNDTALRVQPINQNRPFVRSWNFPDILLAHTLKPIGGRKTWMPCNAFNDDITAKMNIVIGHYPFQSPPFSSNTYVYIGDIEFTFYCKFGKKMPVTAN